MRTWSLALTLTLCAVVPVLSRATTRDIIPAGTLLQCTVSEPNFSQKTAQVGDPVLCHLGPLGSFGHSVFPRGAELGGHLEDAQAPGHFVGKGWMQLEFDRMILPGAQVLPLATKVVSSPHMKVDADGRIRGKGHPVRDTVEWMIPIMWPIKIMTLSARGPYPALKGETRLSLRLMEDIEVPFSTAMNVPRPPWATPSSYHSATYQIFRPASASLEEVSEVAPSTASAPPDVADLRLQTPAQTMPIPVAQPAPLLDRGTAERASDDQMTVIALVGGEAYLAREYWVQGGELHCVSADGDQRAFPLEKMDLYQTANLNRQRNVKFVLQARGPVEQ